MKKIAILLSLIVSAYGGNVLNVPATYTTIQAGIDAASNGDTVLVAAGTYKENINLNQKDIHVIGANRETTIIDGDQKGTVVTFTPDANGDMTNKYLNTVLAGFTITNGKAYAIFTIYDQSGGGIAIIGDAKPTLRDLIIEKNIGLHGGGIYLKNSASPNIENSIIRNNEAWDSGTGGGIYLHDYSGTMKNLVFEANTANGWGGHIAVLNPYDNISVNIINSTFVEHWSSKQIALSEKSKVNITNSILWGTDIYTHTSDVSLNVKNSIIKEAQYSNSVLYPWYTGTDNIELNPKFVKVITTGDEESDYHLSDSSPAIGTGTATGAPTTDIEGNPRPNPAGSNPDMGAFENKWGTPQNATPVITAMSDVTINEDESYSDTLSATDEEGEAITYSAVSDTSAITASITDSILTITPNANWNGVANIKAYASDGTSKDSTSFKVTVTPVQDAPTAFDWVSSALDTINITQSNLTDTYTLQWDASTDAADGDSINYLVYAKVGVYPAEEIYDTTVTSVSITYQEILEGVFEGSPVNGATVSLNVKATDGVDTVDVTGDNRVIYVNRYEYLSTEGEGVPVEFALHENYPNPFNPTTTLRFDLPEVSNITLTIYNMLGQNVRTFNYQNTSAGYHSVKWNATNDYGDPVGAGVYLYQLQTKDFVKTRKMVLLK